MLAVVPIRDGVLPAGGAETVAECGGRAVLIGSGVGSAVNELQGIAVELQLVETGAFAPRRWATQLAPVLADAKHVVLPASPDGRDLAPHIAASLHCELYAGAIAVTPTHVELARYGGLVISDFRPEGNFVATLQPGVRGVEADATLPAPTVAAASAANVEPATNGRAAAATTTTTAPTTADRGVTVIETLAPDAATMDLSEAPRILGGGAGLRTVESFAELSTLATALDASMGATRVVTDRGWVGHERQIGTTGVIVSPKLYIAFGISGAVQHTSGLGQPDHIISVNTDPHCPMMQHADLAIVSDANEVVSQLLAIVTSGQGATATSATGAACG